jgi:hypothetical protein
MGLKKLEVNTEMIKEQSQESHSLNSSPKLKKPST